MGNPDLNVHKATAWQVRRHAGSLKISLRYWYRLNSSICGGRTRHAHQGQLPPSKKAEPKVQWTHGSGLLEKLDSPGLGTRESSSHERSAGTVLADFRFGWWSFSWRHSSSNAGDPSPWVGISCRASRPGSRRDVRGAWPTSWASSRSSSSPCAQDTRSSSPWRVARLSVATSTQSSEKHMRYTHRAVAIFSRCGPRWVSTLFRDGFSHVAVGYQDVVYDPFVSPRAPFIPRGSYMRFASRYGAVSVIVPTVRPILGGDRCCTSGPGSSVPAAGSFAAWAWSVMTSQDCVGLACSLFRSAGVNVPVVYRPSSLMAELVRRS